MAERTNAWTEIGRIIEKLRRKHGAAKCGQGAAVEGDLYHYHIKCFTWPEGCELEGGRGSGPCARKGHVVCPWGAGRVPEKYVPKLNRQRHDTFQGEEKHER